MDKYVVKDSNIHLFAMMEQARLKTRLRILWHLWKRESIDSYAFNNTADILFGMQMMLKNKVYCKKIIEQLEEQTLHYLFPEKSRIKFGKLHQKRYLLLQRLFSFIGDKAGISFAARYGYIEQIEEINQAEYRELSNLENSGLDFFDYLTNITIKDIKKANFNLFLK
jgi:hypothetical protein